MNNSNKTIPAVAFVGKQNSGKTTLLVKVISELTAQGIRVATIKHHSHAGFEFDVEGKDSWRHRQAGSVLAAVSAPDQMAWVRKLEEEMPVEQIIADINSVAAIATAEGSATPPPDIILVEGYRRSSLPTIELFRADNPNDQQRNLGGEGNEIIAVVTDMERISAAANSQPQPLPVFGFEQITSLAVFIRDRFLDKIEP
ncbi:MAG: molybdopterin-guanine dinucleotide biosynthesis protein B [Coriobacteriales bacterium]|jgi:molybdopterin-guanine dinucleotide biosynthesis protein MobB|nr:molybdopterin-guanine dinucleotide biosynthesis protein B [Coriobacteriales bacterium]